MLQWIMQNNKLFALAQTQYKVTDQIHGNTCIRIIEVVVTKYVRYLFQNVRMHFRLYLSVVYTYGVLTQRKCISSCTILVTDWIR